MRRGWAQLLSVVDAPGRHAFLLAGRPVLVSASIASAAGVVVLGAGAAASHLSGEGTAQGPALALVIELWVALAMVLPSAAILAAYARLPLSPRVWLGGLAVALVTTAVVSLSALPFLVYLNLVSTAGAGVLPDVLLAAVAGVAVASTLARVIRAADPGPRGVWTARLFGLGVAAAFAAQSTTTTVLQGILHFA